MSRRFADAGLPPAAKVLAQARGGVVALRGTLPPKGDQTNAPEWGQGMMDIVGDPAQLADLLTQVALPFVEPRAR